MLVTFKYDKRPSITFRSDETALSFVHVLSVDRLVCELASEVHFS